MDKETREAFELIAKAMKHNALCSRAADALQAILDRAPAEEQGAPKGSMRAVCVVLRWAEELGYPPHTLTAAPSRHHDAALAVTRAGRDDPGTKRLLERWIADDWVRENWPPLSHLAGNLAKYSQDRAPAKSRRTAAEERDHTTERQRLQRELEEARKVLSALGDSEFDAPIRRAASGEVSRLERKLSQGA